MSVKLYRVTVTMEKPMPGGGRAGASLPTFYLDPDELGIVGIDHARRIAAKIVGSGSESGTRYHITVGRVTLDPL